MHSMRSPAGDFELFIKSMKSFLPLGSPPLFFFKRDDKNIFRGIPACCMVSFLLLVLHLKVQKWLYKPKALAYADSFCASESKWQTEQILPFPTEESNSTPALKHADSLDNYHCTSQHPANSRDAQGDNQQSARLLMVRIESLTSTGQECYLLFSGFQ